MLILQITLTIQPYDTLHTMIHEITKEDQQNTFAPGVERNYFLFR